MYGYMEPCMKPSLQYPSGSKKRRVCRTVVRSLMVTLGLCLVLMPGYVVSDNTGSGIGRKEMTLTRGDNGKTIEVQAGDSVVVRLDENPTTGFIWAIDQDNDDILPLRHSDYTMAPGAGIGGGGQRTLTFQAQKAGTVSLQLKLWREWEGDQSITERFFVTIQVGG